MKLPNWIRVIWWILLTIASAAFLSKRFSELSAGHPSAVDVIVLVVMIALLLAPLFSEVELLGVRLKQSIDDLKGSVAAQIADMRIDLANAVSVRTTVSPSFTFPQPVADAQLPKLEEQIKRALDDALRARGLQAEKATTQELEVDPDRVFLFSLRYHIEQEVRRIAQDRQVSLSPRQRTSVYQLVRSLVENEVVDPRLGHAVREVYAVCSPAVHGEPTTEQQLAFAKDVGLDMVSALKAIT